MRKLVLHIIVCLTVSLPVLSQDAYTVPPQPNPIHQNNQSPKNFNSFKKRFYVGGNVGAWFGTTTYINISPLVGFKVTKPFSIGAGFTYNYFSQNIGGYHYSSYIYGTNTFVRYAVLENIFVQGGWDRLNVPDFYSPVADSRTWIDNVLIGGGLRQPFSSNGVFVMAVYYNINQGPLSPYPNPIIQIGFNVGL